MHRHALSPVLVMNERRISSTVATSIGEVSFTPSVKVVRFLNYLDPLKRRSPSQKRGLGQDTPPKRNRNLHEQVL